MAARLSLSSFCVGLAVALAEIEVGLQDGESRASYARLRLAQRLMDGYVTLCMVFLILWCDAFMYVPLFPSGGVEPARLRSPFAVPAGLLKAVTLGMLPAARRHAAGMS